MNTAPVSAQTLASGRLTRLVLLPDSAVEDLPHLIGDLVGLRHFALSFTCFDAEGYAPLARLTRLQHLDLSRICGPMPECLSRLTQLRFLAIDYRGDFADEAMEVVGRQLPYLSHLTRLQLDITTDTALALTTLCHLNSLRCNTTDGTALPAGPWLATLQRLVAPSKLIVDSLDALASAPQLERLA